MGIFTGYLLGEVGGDGVLEVKVRLPSEEYKDERGEPALEDSGDDTGEKVLWSWTNAD